MLFTQSIDLYRQHLLAMRRRPDTLTWYAEQFEAYARWRLREGLSDDLPTAETIEAFLADQHKTHKPATVHARFRAIRAVFGFLEKRRKISHDNNPIHLLDAPSVPKEMRRYVTDTDIRLLLAGIGDASWLDARDRLILLILYYSGLRVGELCSLEVEDMDAKAQTIRIRAVTAKGEKARLVPCTGETAQAFVRYLYVRPNHRAELLLASDGYEGVKGPLRREGVRQMLVRRCDAAGVGYYSPHAFRHGFAMWLLNAGMRITSLSTAMGHSDPAVTSQIYAHTTLTTVRSEYDAALKVVRSRPREHDGE